MMNVLLLMTVSGVICPTIAPSLDASNTSDRLPSRRASCHRRSMMNPGSGPVSGSGRSLCFGTYGFLCTSGAATLPASAQAEEIASACQQENLMEQIDTSERDVRRYFGPPYAV